jgi:hypothetical protein
MQQRRVAVKRVGPRRRTLSGLSGLGLILIGIGAVSLLVSFSVLPHWVLGWWPLVLVGVGLFGLLRRPGWVVELDLLLPGFAGAADRPRRWFSAALVISGLFLLLFTTHLVDERLIGPIVIIALGAALLWRRSR